MFDLARGHVDSIRVWPKQWGFKAGVARLYPPLYSGWENGMEVKGLHEEYAAKGEAGYTLSSIFYNQRYFQETGSEFVNNFVLLWVPERYAFSVFNETNFEAFKSRTETHSQRGFSQK